MVFVKSIRNRYIQLVDGVNHERHMFLMMEAVLSNSPLVLSTLTAHLETAGHLMSDMSGVTDRTGRTLLTVAVRIRSMEMVIILAGREGEQSMLWTRLEMLLSMLQSG